MALGGAHIHTPRRDQVVLISESIDRDKWLAGEIDSVQVSAFTGLDGLEKKLNQILAVAVGVLISTLSTTITLLLTGGFG
jgi:hypothetical protein